MSEPGTPGPVLPDPSAPSTTAAPLQPPAPASDTAEMPNLRAARVVAFALVAAKPGAYVREAVLAARFGTTGSADAYNASVVIAQAAWSIIGTPMQRILVPVLVRAFGQRGAQGLRQTSGAVLIIALVASGALGALLLGLAGPLALVIGGPRIAPEVTVLLRWLSPLPLAATLSAFATGWLQAKQRFTLPALAALPVDLAIIAFVLGGPRAGPLAAAWGLLVGTALQFVLQWPGLRYHHCEVASPRALPGGVTADPGLRAAAAMSLPVIVSAGAAQAGLLLQTGLASHLGRGFVASLTYATRVLDVPAALFTLPIVTVALPHFSALSASGRGAEAFGALRRSLRALIAAVLPCALLILLLPQPIAAAVFGHGAFGSLSIALTAGALMGYAPQVIGGGMQELLRVYFYGRQDVATPMRWDLVALAVGGAVAIATRGPLHQVGIALGMGTGALAGVAGMWWTAARGEVGTRHGHDGPLARPLVAGTAALVAVAEVMRRLAPGAAAHGWLHAAKFTAAAGGLALLAYGVVFALAGGAPVLRDLAGIGRGAARRLRGG